MEIPCETNNSRTDEGHTEMTLNKDSTSYGLSTEITKCCYEPSKL